MRLDRRVFATDSLVHFFPVFRLAVPVAVEAGRALHASRRRAFFAAVLAASRHRKKQLQQFSASRFSTMVLELHPAPTQFALNCSTLVLDDSSSISVYLLSIRAGRTKPRFSTRAFRNSKQRPPLSSGFSRHLVEKPVLSNAGLVLRFSAFQPAARASPKMSYRLSKGQSWRRRSLRLAAGGRDGLSVYTTDPQRIQILRDFIAVVCKTRM